jgi:KaiC/GvpD/RAD55 family RecA-like ATPase
VGRLHTGFAYLDRVLTTLRPTTLTVVAGLTSGGKTALTLQIADQIAAKGAGVLFASLEMGSDEIQGRRLCRAAGIPESVYRGWEAGPHDVIRRTRAAESDLRIRPFEVQAGSFSLAEIRAMARRRKARSGLALLVVDYLGLVAVNGKHDNREQEVNAVARGLKACAMELQIAVIAVAQLNREASKATANEAPSLATLRDSGSVEQHANTVLMVHRDGRDERGVLTLTLRKQRGGPLGAVKLVFQGGHLRILRVRRRSGHGQHQLAGRAMRRAPRTDANHQAVTRALRDAGVLVRSLAGVGEGVPDLLCGYRGTLVLLELKDSDKPPSARRLTAAESEFVRTWPRTYVVTSAAEALRVVVEAARPHPLIPADPLEPRA